MWRLSKNYRKKFLGAPMCCQVTLHRDLPITFAIHTLLEICEWLWIAESCTSIFLDTLIITLTLTQEEISVDVVVHLYPWFNFIFPSCIQEKLNFKLRLKLNLNVIFILSGGTHSAIHYWRDSPHWNGRTFNKKSSAGHVYHRHC